MPGGDLRSEDLWCEDLHVELSAWIDGELDAEERARVAAHLQTCHDCSEYVRVLQNNSSLVKALRTPRAPASVTEAAMRQVSAMTRLAAAPRPRRRFSFAWPLPALGIGLAGLAAVLTLAIVVGRQQWLRNPDDNGASFHSAPDSTASPMPNGAGYHLSSAPDSITGTIPITRGYDFRGAQNRREVSTFNARERFAWDHGTWRHERRFGRDGWWWDVEGAWYWYDKPAGGPPAIVSDIRFAADSGAGWLDATTVGNGRSAAAIRPTIAFAAGWGTFAGKYSLNEGKAWAQYRQNSRLLRALRPAGRLDVAIDSGVPMSLSSKKQGEPRCGAVGL